MKKKKPDITTIRELFREKLEFAEVIPEPSVKQKLMHSVARREFLRFNPGNFNVFYLGGVLLAALTLGILIFRGSRQDSQNESKLKETDTVSFSLPVATPVTKNDKPSSLARKVKVQSKHFSGKNVIKTEQQVIPVKDVFQPKNINPSFNKNRIISQDSSSVGTLHVSLLTESLLIDPLVSVGCAPFKVLFHNNYKSYDSCVWTFGDGGYSLQRNPEWIFDVEGEYNVGLTVFSGGREISSNATVMVHPKPKAQFEITPQNAILPDDEIRFLNYSSNSINFRWNFGDGSSSDMFEPYHKYFKFSNYNIKLVVFSEFGCSDSLTVYNAFSGSKYFITFPNAFIPNLQGPSGGFYSSKSDEVAQVFHPNYSGISEYQLKIFSKRGVPIFESNDVSLGWDGYNKGELCESGVYIWKVRGKFRNGEQFIQMGDVTLIKNH